MACKDCGSKDAVGKPPVAKQQLDALPEGGADLISALMSAEELLGGSARGLKNAELVTALCTALTECRAEQSALAKALDEKVNELTDCQDELSDCIEGDDANGDETETLDEDTDPNFQLPAVSPGTGVRSQEVRQNRAVQQLGEHPGWGPSGTLLTGNGERLPPHGQPKSVLNPGQQSGSAGVRVLQQRDDVPVSGQRDTRKLLPGQGHDSQALRGPVLSKHRAGSTHVRPGAAPAKPVQQPVRRDLVSRTAQDESHPAGGQGGLADRYRHPGQL